MLIQQIIEFELRGLDTLVFHVIVKFTRQSGYFRDKTKVFNNKSIKMFLTFAGQSFNI